MGHIGRGANTVGTRCLSKLGLPARTVIYKYSLKWYYANIRFAGIYYSFNVLCETLMKQILSISDQVGPLLQAARKSARLSQTALARRLGISQSRVSSMELDPASISLEQLLAMCSALNLELVVQTKVRASDNRSDIALTESEW